MSKVLGTTGTPAFQIESYQSKHPNCVPAVQVALVVIMAIGITLALLSHFDYLHPAFVYVGAGTSVAALITLGILRGCQKNNLQAAIDDVQSFKDLKAVLEKMEAGRSQDCANCLGADYSLKITSKNFSGDISSTQLDDKIERMLKTPYVPMNEEEKEAVRQIAVLIDEKYGAADSNFGSINVEKYIN